jgi:hypothetical protein
MRFLLTTLLLLLPVLGNAQDSRAVRCRFLSFGAAGDPPPAIAISGKGAETPCPLSSTQLSAEITCEARANAIGFLSSADRKPMATATIPAGINAALLIFIQAPKTPDAAQPPAWRVLVIEDSPKNFPDGGAFIANFYNQDIRFVIGEHKGLLHPAGSHGYAKPEEIDSFNMAPVTFEFLKEDKWFIANESALRFLPGMRYLIFAYVDPVSGRPRINTYQDFIQPDAPVKTTP